jgi:hypothetical protein
MALHIRQWQAEMDARREAAWEKLLEEEIPKSITSPAEKANWATFDTFFPLPNRAHAPEDQRAVANGDVWHDCWFVSSEAFFDKSLHTIFSVKGKFIPDWLYGCIGMTERRCIVDSGTVDDFKDSVLDVFEDSMVAHARNIFAGLKFYGIRAVSFKANMLDRELTVNACSPRPVYQLANLMINKKIRNVMRGRVSVHVMTKCLDQTSNQIARYIYKDGEILDFKVTTLI